MKESKKKETKKEEKGDYFPDHRALTKHEFVKFLEKNPTINESPKFGGQRVVVDIGCGVDYPFMPFFRKLNFSWTGVDLVSGPKNLKGDMCDLPYPDNTADLVFSCHAFEHCDNPIQALKEMKRIAKPSGVVFLSTPNCFPVTISLAR